jgi:hypothetical protein
MPVGHVSVYVRVLIAVLIVAITWSLLNKRQVLEKGKAAASREGAVAVPPNARHGLESVGLRNVGHFGDAFDRAWVADVAIRAGFYFNVPETKTAADDAAAWARVALVAIMFGATGIMSLCVRRRFRATASRSSSSLLLSNSRSRLRTQALLLLLVPALTGCAAIRMQRIEPYYAAAFPLRDPALHAAWDVNGAPNDGYVPSDDDEIALWLENSSGKRGPRMTVSRDALVVLQDVDTARLTLRLLRALHAFQLLNPTNPAADVTTEPADYAQWSILRQKLEAVMVDCGGAGICRLRASLEPREPAFVVPGEEVVIERTYRNESSVCEVPATTIADSVTAIVDSAGWIDVPAVAPLAASISTIAMLGDHNPTEKNRLPALRLAGAEIAASYGRVRAWSPSAKQHSLDEIGACLSVATLLPGQTGCVVTDAEPAIDQTDGLRLPADFVANCLAAGVDRQFATCPTQTVLNVYYRLATRLFWTLVDERGQRLTVPYRGGATVEEAVRREYLRVRGRELVVPGLIGGAAYLAVLPDPRTGEVRRFYLKVKYGRRQPDALLRPNDVVFVSRSWPERLLPD